MSTNNSLAITGVAVAIPGTVQVCLALGGSIVQLVKDYHHSDSIAEDLALKIDSKWKNMQKILNNLHRVSARLDLDLESEIRPILIKLSEVLIKARERAAKLGMLSPPAAGDSVSRLAKEGHIPPATATRVRPPPVTGAVDTNPVAASVCWSKGELQNLLSQCEEWEALISSRLLIIIMFESKLLDNVSEEQKWKGPTVRLLGRTSHVTNVSSDQISSNWSADVQELNFNSEAFTIIQLQRSMIRYMQNNAGNLPNYLVEFRQYHFAHKEKSDSKNFAYFQSDLYDTAKMLKGAVPQLMSILQSPGVTCNKSQSGCFELLYTVPSYLIKPRSLRDLLMSSSSRDKDGTLLIPLNHRIRVANRIAVAVLYVHSGHFVHKHIKPENIIVFETDDNNTFPSIIGHPFLVGFDRSRAEASYTIGEGDVFLADCIYQHPERWGIKAQHRFTMLHDIYSLGVVLLEIGLWKSFVKWDTVSSRRVISWRGLEGLFDGEELKKPFSPHHVKERFIVKAKQLLPAKVGQRYTDVVVACLSSSIDDGIDMGDELEVKVGLAYIKNVMSKLEALQV